MSKKLSVRDSTAIARRVHARADFNTHGNTYGTTTGRMYPGWLGGSALARWRADCSTVDYVVVSYSTPIAWHTPEHGWVVIGHNFSASSTKHQHAARFAVATDDDTRVTSLQVSYGLSETQLDMLRRVANETMPVRTASVTGQQSRTLAVLYRLDLVQDNLNGYLTVTDEGREAWA